MKKKQATTEKHYSPRAVLVAIGMKLRALKLLQPIEELVKIRQKTIKYSPVQKLMDGLITILAGAHGFCEINTRLRSDPALQRAFGRSGCAEQSVVQETLDACSATNVKQMEQGTAQIFRAQSLAYRHNYKQYWQVLDIDMTGLPCGSKSVKAHKGYFSKAGIRHGRQLGRVIAAEYEEVVVDKLYNGNVQLLTAQRSLVRAAAEALDLEEAKRKRTIIRVDAGGGSVDEVNWLLGNDYQAHCKDFSSARAKNLAKTVKEWVSDPSTAGRELGWVNEPGEDYIRPVRRLALRWKKKNGQMNYAVIISTLEPRDVILLTKQPIDRVSNKRAVMGAYAAFYNQRGGTVEIEIKEDKQGVGMTKRSKKRFEAQQMVVLLNSLAHNLLVWSRRWLSATTPKLREYGFLRLVRDAFQVSGFVELDARGKVIKIVLNQKAAWAKRCINALNALLKPERVSVILGET
jgi:Transposase DDE domain group 1